MARLKWDRVNVENLTQRRKSEFPQDYIDINEDPKTSRLSPEPAKLIDIANPQASYVECKARMRVRSLTKHYRKVHKAALASGDLNVQGKYTRGKLSFNRKKS